MDDNFRVVLSIKLMPAVLEFGPQFRKVVDFTVVDDPGRAILVEHGLVAARDINNGKTAHAETRAVGDIDTFVVGTTVHDLVAHVADESFTDVALAARAYDPGNSTHGDPLSSGV